MPKTSANLGVIIHICPAIKKEVIEKKATSQFLYTSLSFVEYAIFTAM